MRTDLLGAGGRCGVSTLARTLGRASSTVSREIWYNGWGVAYRAGRAARLKPAKLGQRPRLRRLVPPKLEARWSRQQIAGWLQRTIPSEPAFQVPHEIIDQTLFGRPAARRYAS